jgi:glutathione synthase/RimK-type ligase-like ATP-grasp enzyme
MNHPISNSRAESKLWQLSVARESGFNIPETVVTNSARVAKRDVGRWPNGGILKALDAPLIVVDGEDRFVFTTLLQTEHLENTAAFAAAPLVVQQRLDPKRDVRVTVVGHRIFAAEAINVTEQDWRAEHEPVQFHPYELEPRVARLCDDFVHKLNLRFGALDLVETDGRLYFLEVNPNGEWGWLEAAGFAIAEAIVEELIGSD